MTTSQHHHPTLDPSAGTVAAPAPSRVRVRARQVLAALATAAVLGVALISVTGSTNSEPASPASVRVVQPDLDDPATRQEFVDRFEPGFFGPSG